MRVEATVIGEPASSVLPDVKISSPHVARRVRLGLFRSASMHQGACAVGLNNWPRRSAASRSIAGSTWV